MSTPPTGAATGTTGTPTTTASAFNVVLRSRASATPQQSNMAVPVVSLADRDVISGNRRQDRPPVLRGRGSDEIGALLDRAGDLRQVGRSSGFAIQMMG